MTTAVLTILLTLAEFAPAIPRTSQALFGLLTVSYPWVLFNSPPRQRSVGGDMSKASLEFQGHFTQYHRLEVPEFSMVSPELRMQISRELPKVLVARLLVGRRSWSYRQSH